MYKTTVPLFDIDQTLINNRGTRGKSFEHAIKKVFGIEVSADNFSTHGMIDPEIMTELLKYHGHDNIDITKQKREAYLREMENHFFADGVNKLLYEPMSGAEKALQYLVQNNYLIGILTGNTEKISHYKLKAARLDSYCNFGLFGDQVERRTELSELAKEKVPEYFPSGVKPKLIIIGDSPRDVHAAHEANLPAIGIGAGNYSVKELLDAGADAAIESLENPEILISCLEQLTRI
ncbi:MAG: HAD hydrolase-like protein [Patescibacteria group bacterium]